MLALMPSALVFAQATFPFFQGNTGDQADSGLYRLANNQSIAAEVNPAGVDILITATTTNIWQSTVTFDAPSFTESGVNVPNVNDNLSVFAATTSAQLLGLITDETGSGLLVFGTSPTIVTPTFSGSINFSGTLPFKSVFISATAGSPTLTAGCADGVQTETITNKVNYWSCAFDGSIDQNWQTTFTLPKNYTGGTFTVAVEWTGTSTGNTEWEISILALADDDPFDTAFGAVITVTDTVTVAGDFQRSPESAAITASNIPSPGDRIWINVKRDAVNDTNNDLGRLSGIYLTFTIDSFSTED